ncbi:dihydroxyacetone kinase subunit L [Caloramator sp. E03]|uniref:dihydroxyacetone kinase subunit DhaL n=1 Tax=Caloramator sp. E03 TaxID=2576307 RepID=UPI001110CE32|nr:dihydroxyacetone kinase subunit DhaL [Caloramator sp. E03]QCX33334.1 dihydroxyacetone kinase subunit L [Caloramator sp. E03]
MTVNYLQVKNIIYKIADVIEENKMYLTNLDAAIGDGDHGLNMSKGFKVVKEKLESDESKNIGDILKKVSMALISTVGGASGPLYGTAFMKAGMKAINKDEIDINDFTLLLEEALKGIKDRGKATIGEKTMVDTLEPALYALKASINDKLDCVECLDKMMDAAFIGKENTKDMIAKKGRASYLGERSKGHLDPGAVSSYLILKTICDEVKAIRG